MQAPNQPDNQNDPREAMAIALLIARTWATSCEVFLHRNMGSRYLGLQAAAVFPLVFFYCTAWQGHDVRPMLLFLFFYFVALIGQRILIWRRGRNVSTHSYYTGRPDLWPLCPKASEVAVKKLLEPAFCGIVGAALYQLNAPLGTYLLIGGVCLSVTVAASEVEVQTRAMDMNDAVVDQEIAAERFRAMREDRWN